MLKSSNLLLRPLSVSDAPQFFALNENPSVVAFVPDKAFADEAAAYNFLHSYFDSQPDGFGRMAVIRQSDNAWLGWCGLKYHPDEDMVDLGYRFFQKYWGQGYATESSRLSIRYGFETLGLKEIIGRVAPENIGSVSVLKKCGFRLKGKFTEADWQGDEYVLSLDSWIQNQSKLG